MPRQLLRLVNARGVRKATEEGKTKWEMFLEDLPIILLNCLVVAVIAAIAIFEWPVTEEMMFAAAKAFILAFVVQLQKYLRSYEPSERK